MLLLRAFRSASSHLNRTKRLNSHRLMGLQRKSGSESGSAADPVEEDAPVKFSESPALNWKARDSRLGGRQVDRLWYEPFVIIASLSVFLLYFTVLREENDVDEGLNQSLFSRVPGLEEKHLQLVLESNRQRGLDSTAVIERLKEIQGDPNRPEV